MHSDVEQYHTDIVNVLSLDWINLTLSEIEQMTPGEFTIYKILFANKATENAE